MGVRGCPLEGMGMRDLSFYKGKKVLITGHTGFKGSYLTAVLLKAGADITGYSLEPPTDPSLFKLCKLENDIKSVTGDVRDYDKLLRTFRESKAEIVFHLAAQPIVRISYREPRLTYETNVMGTVNLLECVRQTDDTRSVLNVTTDKVYMNNDSGRAFREDDGLDGFEPYSNSKSCSELVTKTYMRCYFDKEDAVAVSTARAGNVIGGGDFAPDRLIPDCVRAAENKEKVIIRNPASTRPFQHVLEPVSVYLMIAEKQYQDKKYAGHYNVGPDIEDVKSAGEMAKIFAKVWGDGLETVFQNDGGPKEAAALVLDCSRLKECFRWKSVWNAEEAVRRTVQWSKVYVQGGDVKGELMRQVEEYFG